MLLNAVGDRASKLARKQRIFAETFEIASGTGVSVDVDCWAQDHLGALETGLVGDLFTHTAQKLSIPC